MVSQCANPDCRRELRYLRDGKIYAFAMSTGNGSKSLEHFWLCGECSKSMTLTCLNQSEVKTAFRGQVTSQRFCSGRLMLRCWLKNRRFYESGHYSWRGISRL